MNFMSSPAVLVTHFCEILMSPFSSCIHLNVKTEPSALLSDSVFIPASLITVHLVTV